jgi:hypothetical protein
MKTCFECKHCNIRFNECSFRLIPIKYTDESCRFFSKGDEKKIKITGMWYCEVPDDFRKKFKDIINSVGINSSSINIDHPYIGSCLASNDIISAKTEFLIEGYTVISIEEAIDMLKEYKREKDIPETLEARTSIVIDMIEECDSFKEQLKRYWPQIF